MVSFIYFSSVIVFSMIIMHPAAMLISAVCAVCCCFVYKMRAKSFIYIAPAIIITALVNPLFNHRGQTVLAYFKNGNPFTLESLIYGGAAALLLLQAAAWFCCANKVLTSDKYMYIFGSIMPSLSLVLTFSLRFVPMLGEEIKKTSQAQKALGNDAASGSVVKRIKSAAAIFFSMLSWSLERGAAASVSMRSRGYGCTKRGFYTAYRLEPRDLSALVFIVLEIFYILFGLKNGALKYTYFPRIKNGAEGMYSATVIAAYFALCALPLVLGILEEIKWKRIKSAI